MTLILKIIQTQLDFFCMPLSIVQFDQDSSTLVSALTGEFERLGAEII